MSKLVFSVAYPLDQVDGQKGIWLGLKKLRPFRERAQLGIGFYNGFGGLKRKNETIETTAMRETLAESGLKVLAMKRCGIALVLHDYDDAEVELHFFLVTGFLGQAKETIEMAPRFFPLDQIHYGTMWQNDRHTLPRFLAGELCVAQFKINERRALTEPPKVRVVRELPKRVHWKNYKF